MTKPVQRHTAHFQGKEALLERLLRHLRLRHIVRQLPADSVVVDLGCGYDAGFLYAVLPKIRQGIGLDLLVGQSTDERLQLLAHNLNEPLPLISASVDVVVSMANLEHLEQPQALLKEAQRILRPGGRLILTTPSVYAKPILEFLAFRLHIVSVEEISDHKMYFNKKILNDFFQRAGFNQIQHHYFQLGMNNFVLAVKD